MIDSGDFGWGGDEAETASAFDGLGSAVLVVATGVYCGALWVASGLQPLPYLASRARTHLHGSLQAATSVQ